MGVFVHKRIIIIFIPGRVGVRCKYASNII